MQEDRELNYVNQQSEHPLKSAVLYNFESIFIYVIPINLNQPYKTHKASLLTALWWLRKYRTFQLSCLRSQF